MFRKQSKPQSRIDSLIGSATRIEGNVYFSGGLRIDGTVRGNVCALPEQPGTIVLSEHARIEGEAHAAHLVVNGAIHGPVHATESLELLASAQVRGDVHYKSLEIHQGAVIEGRLIHQDGADVKTIGLKLAS